MVEENVRIKIEKYRRKKEMISCKNLKNQEI